MVLASAKEIDRCVPIAFVVMMGWVSLRVDGKMVTWGGSPQLRRLTITTGAPAGLMSPVWFILHVGVGL